MGWGGRGHSAPRDFPLGNLCQLTGKNKARKKSEKMENVGENGKGKGKMKKKGKRKKKNGKGKEENEEKFDKGRRKMTNVRGKQPRKTEDFFFLLFTCRKPLKLFGIYQNGNFYREKVKITLGKNWEK